MFNELESLRQSRDEVIAALGDLRNRLHVFGEKSPRLFQRSAKEMGASEALKAADAIIALLDGLTLTNPPQVRPDDYRNHF